MPLLIIDLIAVCAGAPLGEGYHRMVGASRECMRYAITEFAAQGTDPEDLVQRWTDALERWMAQGIDVIQLRERSLRAGVVLALAARAMALLRTLPEAHRPSLLLHSRPDLALAAGADGVHLTAHPGEMRPTQVRRLAAAAGRAAFTVSVSSHTLAEVQRAREERADLILFGPVFEKRVNGQIVVPGVGTDRLREAVRTAEDVPVLALGGITEGNAESCLGAGAAGIAAIRLFAMNR